MAPRKRGGSKAGKTAAAGGPWADSLQNILSGLGTERDSFTGMRFTNAIVSVAQLEAAYRGDWIARKVVDVPAQDATREWRSWQADGGDITAIEDLEDALGLQRKVHLGLKRARLYGGAALLIGVDQGALNEEVRLDSVRKDSLKFVHVVSRHEIGVGPIRWGIDDPYYGEPEYYQRTVGRGEMIHPSRVVRLIGNELPDPRQGDGWGDSVLQSVFDSIKQVGVVLGGTAKMVDDAKLDIVKIPQLQDNVGNKDYEQRLKDKFALANVSKSVFATILLDKEEEWERITNQFAGLPDVLKMYLLVASGAADIPATRMLGQSPAGLSATGDSDVRNYYDRVRTEQNTVLRPTLERLDQILIRSATGSFNESIHYEWESLWQMDDKQKAEIAKSKADAHKVDVDTGLIPPEVLREARINQLVEDGTYPGLEEIVEEFGEMDDLGEPAPAPAPIPPPAPPSGAQPSQENGEPPIESGEARAADAMARRARRAAVRDATPRTLYVRRDLVNVDAVRQWAESVGLKLVDDPHVTICYSRAAVDWSKAGEAWGQDEDGRLRVPPGGMRMIEKLGSNSIALLFASSNLTYRHVDLKERLGTTWDYPDYQPHVTVEERDGPLDVRAVEPYAGELVFGPEVFEEARS